MSTTAAVKDANAQYCIVLLDGQRLEVVAEPETMAAQLLDVVAAKIGLSENGYFGLAYFDNMGSCHWLQNERRLGEHDLPHIRQPLVLYFLVRFFVPSFMVVKDSWSLMLLYLHVRQVIWTGHLECDINTVVDLASFSLQAAYGDCREDISVSDKLHCLSLIPSCLMKIPSTMKLCEQEIVEGYKKLIGMSRGLAITSYLSIVEKLPTYGTHYYKVKDKKGVVWWLGVSWRGIAVYDQNTRSQPRKIFPWKHLENIYFHEKKFSIEVLDLRNGSVPADTTQDGSHRVKVKVYSWLLASIRLTKTIWNMSVSEHQFYLEWKHAKSKSTRLLSDVIRDLNAVINNDPSAMSLLATETVVTFGGGHDTSPGVIMECGNQLEKSLSIGKDADAVKAAQLSKHTAFKERKRYLEDQLNKKLEELYAACAQEAAITGVIPLETPFIRGKPPITIPKKMGTEFTLPAKFLSPEKNEPVEAGQLDIQFEIQKQQVEAVLKLSQEKSLARTVRRKYRQQYRDAHLKLKHIEEKLNAQRRRNGRSLVNIPDTVDAENSEDSQEFLDCPDPDDLLSPQQDGTSSLQDSVETGSLASQQSCRSEGHVRIRPKTLRSKSSSNLNSLGGSLPKMEIQEYDKPPTLLAPVRSISSNSLKDPISQKTKSSPSSEIKIYPKMVHRPLNSPQLHPYMLSYQMSEPSTYSIPSSLYNDSGVGSVPSSIGHRISRRPIRAPSSQKQQPPSPNLSNCSDVSERRLPPHRSSTDDVIRRGSSKFSLTSSESNASYCSSVTGVSAVGGEFLRGNGSTAEVAADASSVTSPTMTSSMTSPVSYEEQQTRTWPRKRGNRSSRRRTSDEEVEPEPVPVAVASSTPVSESCTSATLNDSLDLAEVSPTKFGGKRDGVDFRESSPFFGVLPHDLKSGLYYGSDLSVTRGAAIHDVVSPTGTVQPSAGGHYSNSRQFSPKVISNQQQHLQHRDISAMYHSPISNSVNHGHAESILLSQSRRHPENASARVHRNEISPSTPADYRPLYEPCLYGVAGVGDPFNFLPTSRAFAHQHSASSAAVYSPSRAAGRNSISGPSNRHAVDVLFDNIYSTKEDDSLFGSASHVGNYGRPAPPPAPQWSEATISRAQPAGVSRRARSVAVSSVPTNHHDSFTLPSTSSRNGVASVLPSTSSHHRQRKSLPSQTLVWRSPSLRQSHDRRENAETVSFEAVDVSVTSTLV